MGTNADMLITVHSGDDFPTKGAVEVANLPTQEHFHSIASNRPIPKKNRKPLYMKQMSTFDESLIKHHFYTPKDASESF